MSKIAKLLPSVAIGVLAVATLLVVAPDTSAQIQTGLDAAGGAEGIQQDADPATIIRNIVNIFLYIVGAVAVIMIIFSGFQFLTSAGDSSKAQKARTTLIYAIVGLLVAVFSLAIINFVMDQVGAA